MSDIPQFRKRRRDAVESFAQRVFTKPGEEGSRHLWRLIGFADDHWRAVFNPEYFTLAEGRSEPSKSQWNTLKKRMKRMDASVFIFKEHGETLCEPETEVKCCYVDFGFLNTNSVNN